MEQKLAVVVVKDRAGRTVSETETCKRLGISPQTHYKYRRRFATEGMACLIFGSRRPKASPTRTAPHPTSSS